MTGPRLVLVPRNPAAFAGAVAGGATVSFDREGEFAAAIRAALPERIATRPAGEAAVHCVTEAGAAARFAAFAPDSAPAGQTVVAPEAPGSGLDAPLFLISIPKSGTHLLYRLAEALGYAPGIVCPARPRPGHWYCLEFSNSHTVPRDFFVDSVRRAPFGGRAHPFPAVAALFILRHPLDILVSEANYVARPGRTLYSGRYEARDFAARVATLLDDEAMLGRFARRVADFAPWLDFPNVLPLTYEDLVGPEGGGERGRQRDLVWSLMLRLGIPGAADDIAARLYDRDSPTFGEGRIGANREALPLDLRRRAAAELAPVMAAFGYEPDAPYSRHAAEWRARAPRLARERNGAVPILVDPDFLGHGIVLLDDVYLAVPQGAGPIDVAALGADRRARLLRGASLDEVRHAIAAQPLRAAIAALAEADRARAAEHEAALRAATERLDSLEATMEERTGRLAALEATLVERTARIAALEAAIEERHVRLSALERSMQTPAPPPVEAPAGPAPAESGKGERRR